MIKVTREKRQDVFLGEADIRRAFDHMGDVKEVKAKVGDETKTYNSLDEVLNSKDKISELKIIS